MGSGGSLLRHDRRTKLIGCHTLIDIDLAVLARKPGLAFAAVVCHLVYTRRAVQAGGTCTFIGVHPTRFTFVSRRTLTGSEADEVNTLRAV